MTIATSCAVRAFHLDGRPVAMIAFGAESVPRRLPSRCGDCGVGRGGFHHPGCDMQRCPLCRGQMITCGCRFDEDGPDDDEDGPDDDEDEADDDEAEALFVDGNGAPAQLRLIGGRDVIVHDDDAPAGSA